MFRFRIVIIIIIIIIITLNNSINMEVYLLSAVRDCY
jgi:hypothetical protein